MKNIYVHLVIQAAFTLVLRLWDRLKANAAGSLMAIYVFLHTTCHVTLYSYTLYIIIRYIVGYIHNGNNFSSC